MLTRVRGLASTLVAAVCSVVLVRAGAQSPVQAAGQSPCTAPPLVLPPAGGPVALSEQQEVDLGDAIAEHMQRGFPVVDDQTNEYLQQIGDRILKQLPATALRFRFQLVNIPDVNAFALPGGRVYVSRKMVALTQNEDELAGIVAHEIGHIITRQLGAQLTREFKDALNVTTFGDRADVFDKYHRLVDHPRPGSRDLREENDQYEADAVALAAAARAGYSPDAFVDFWDRFAETDHKTGNFVTDLFGTTRPEQRRLRQMVRTIATVPPQCRPPVAATARRDFADWRSRVVGNSTNGRTADIRGLLEEHALEPALNAEIRWLRFSPDGRYVLAQAEGSLTVLTREPFTPVLQIEADDALAAQFTPDSQAIVFATQSRRVERWDLATRTRTNVHEMAVRNGCGGGALSPDGRFLGCLEVTDEGATGYFNTQLTLFDVATGEPAFKKTRSFPLPTHTPIDPLALLRALVRSGGFSLVFSPDARYFVLGYADGETVVDVSARVEARLPAEIRRVFRGSFAFVGTDRVAVVDAERPDHSALVKFPSGDPIRTLTLTGRVDAATRGDYLLVRLAQTVAIVDIAQDKVIGASNSSSLDIYDTYRVAEQPNGDLALYGAESTRPMAVAALPRALLGDMSGSSISQGLKWVSLSAADRGGLWNLETGRRALLVRGFTSSGVAPDGILYADFPHDKRIVDGKVVDLPRMLTRVTADGHATEVSPLGGIAARISNQFLTVMTAERPDAPDAYNRRATLSVLEIATRTPLWARKLPERNSETARRRCTRACHFRMARRDRGRTHRTRGGSTAEGRRGRAAPQRR